ncbi:uncharacterized protein LOC6557505 isoform X2 [Drosophila grimshawi]|uniref:uncharacterized protein LOC6557505 isoform X2 n=1 Tax=Drosophila grimshawi TaxID=7222 RepID=UPI000C86ED75|nr:uncharacterized protein LOC6557505 isoform X2 [Drosophila grimshawi]
MPSNRVRFYRVCRADNTSALSVKTNSLNIKSSASSNNQHIFDLDDDESFFDLCPDPSAPRPSSDVVLPSLSGTSDTSSVVLLTPATQDIVFIDDSITEANNLNTMAFMEEAIKQDDKVSLAKLQEFEADLIRKCQFEAANVKPIAISAAKPAASVKQEPLTELPSDFGNESTKLPEDFDMDDDEQEEEEIFPLPIVIKQEKQMSARDRFNIDCVQCEKFINFMGNNFDDEKIRKYLSNCRHHDERELENNTPDGFWNPHMVSFADDDPRNKVHVDRRFVDQQKK